MASRDKWCDKCKYFKGFSVQSNGKINTSGWRDDGLCEKNGSISIIGSCRFFEKKSYFKILVLD